MNRCSGTTTSAGGGRGVSSPPDGSGLEDVFLSESVSLIHGVIPTMLSRELKIIAAVLVSAGATGMGWAADQPPGDAQPAVARPGPARMVPEAAAIYKYVKLQLPGEFKWQQIPWLVDLAEAIRQARAENRPILIWATDDDPLERC